MFYNKILFFLCFLIFSIIYYINFIFLAFDLDQKLNETSILTFTLVNKNETVYKFKGGENKPKTPASLTINNKTQPHMTSVSIPKTLKDRQLVFSNKNSEINLVQKKETISKCDCFCFQWLFKKKSKEVLLEGTISNDAGDNAVKNSGI